MRRGLVLDSLSTDICNTNSYSGCKDRTKLNLSSSDISLHQYRTELYSHTDTFSVGNNVLITHVHGINGISNRVNVHAYDPALGCVEDINVINAAVAYDYPNIGEVLILKIKQAVHIPSMSNNLLCTMQLMLSDDTVFERLGFLTENPNHIDHSIIVASTEDT